MTGQPTLTHCPVAASCPPAEPHRRPARRQDGPWRTGSSVEDRDPSQDTAVRVAPTERVGNGEASAQLLGRKELVVVGPGTCPDG